MENEIIEEIKKLDPNNDNFCEEAVKAMKKLGIDIPTPSSNQTIEVPTNYSIIADLKLKNLEKDYSETFGESTLYASQIDNKKIDESDEDSFEEVKENTNNDQDNYDVINNNISQSVSETNSEINNDKDFYEVVESGNNFINANIIDKLENTKVNHKLDEKDRNYLKNLINNKENSNKLSSVMKTINLKPPNWAKKYIFNLV